MLQLMEPGWNTRPVYRLFLLHVIGATKVPARYAIGNDVLAAIRSTGSYDWVYHDKRTKSRGPVVSIPAVLHGESFLSEQAKEALLKDMKWLTPFLSGVPKSVLPLLVYFNYFPLWHQVQLHPAMVADYAPPKDKPSRSGVRAGLGWLKAYGVVDDFYEGYQPYCAGRYKVFFVRMVGSEVFYLEG